MATSITPFGAVGDASRSYPKPRGIVDTVCLSDLSIAAFIWTGDGYALLKDLYPCRRYFWLVQETPAPVSICPLIASGLNCAIGC